MCIRDSPSYLYFFGDEQNKTEYREGVFVGYRYYDKKNMDVLFPFGYGLSYTTFEYSNLTLDKSEMKDTDTLTVSVNVRNTGKVKGKDCLLYTSGYQSDSPGDALAYGAVVGILVSAESSGEDGE